MHRPLALALAALLVSTPAGAQDRPQGWYLTGFAGAALFDDLRVVGVGTGFDAPIDTGLGFGGGVGYALTPEIRTELEIAVRSGDVDLTTEARYAALTVMLNVWYDIPVELGGIQPFIGGGIGIAESELMSTSQAQGAQDTVLALQVGGGASLPLSENLEIFLQYRFVHVEAVEIQQSSGSASFQADSHNIEGGLRLWLN